MTPEQIARRYEELGGFELVDYAECALPLWQLGVEAISIAHKRLQPIKEFSLRALDAGLAEEELPGFLGLDEAVVRGALIDLERDKLLARTDTMMVTDAGRKVLSEGFELPLQEQIQILFDGILRVPIAAQPAELAWPRDIEEGVVAEIAATPTDRPQISDINISDVDRVLAEMAGGRRDLGRDILRLKQINRHRRIFRRGVALVFKAPRSSDLRIFFVVNGVRDEDLERRFAEAGGTARRGFVRAFSDAYLNANLRRHLGAEVTQKMIDPSSYAAAQRVVSIAKLRRDGLARKAAMVAKGQLAPDEAPDAQSVADAAAAEQAAVQQIENAPSRPASVYERAEMLERALSNAKTRLSISSKGLAPHIVDKAFLAQLAKRIQAGVAVTISLHEDGVKWGARKGEWSNAYAALQKLSQASDGRFKVRVTREERYYHLAWDDEFALVCNRPILSNPGRIRTFEQFAGYVLQDRALIQSYLDRVNR